MAGRQRLVAPSERPRSTRSNILGHLAVLFLESAKASNTRICFFSFFHHGTGEVYWLCLCINAIRSA